jgi:hypothetical protein
MNINFLKIPLYKLSYIDDLSGFAGLTAKEMAALKDEYDEEELRAIIEVVKWATENPDYDFLSLDRGLRVSNQEIHKFLCKIAASLRQLE